jgi:hypothetical protein
MFFWGGIGSPLVIERQRLAPEKFLKNKKSAKKVFDISPDTPVF